MLRSRGQTESLGRAFERKSSTMIGPSIASRLPRALTRIARHVRRERPMIKGVLIDNVVFEKMELCSRRFAPLEAGGLILGHRKNSFLHALDVTLPGSWDRHSRSSFHRSVKAHRLRALRLAERAPRMRDEEKRACHRAFAPYRPRSHALRRLRAVTGGRRRGERPSSLFFGLGALFWPREVC